MNILGNSHSPSIAKSNLGSTFKAFRRLSKSRPAKAVRIRLLAATLGILQGVLVARLGGPEIKGASATFIATTALLFQAANFDLGQQVVRLAKDRANLSLIRPIVWKVVALYLTVFIALGISLSLLFGDPTSALVATGTFALLVNMYLSYGSMASKGPVITAYSVVLQQVSFALATVLLYLFGVLTPVTICLAVVVGFLTPIPLLNHSLPKASPGVSPHGLGVLGQLAKSGASWHVAQVCQVAIYSSGVLIVSVLFGASAAGVFSVAVGLAFLGQMASQQVSGNAYHKMNTLDVVDLKKEVVRILAVEAAVAILIAANGWWVINTLYGEEFSSAYWITLALLPGSIAWGVTLMSGKVIRVYGRSRQMFLYSASGALVMVLVLLLLGRSTGPVGVALATTVAMIWTAAVSLPLASRIALEKSRSSMAIQRQ